MMATQSHDTDQKPSSFDQAPAVRSCRRRKNFGSGSFVSNLRDHFHEFLQASASEHRTCLKETVQKMLKASKAYNEKSADPVGESSLPLQTTTKE
ncbi:hypothetical protein FEM48_Zijuj08G0100800 [Ziziphus jujuba var. spinosa]|uniref:Uncharacterized protein n=1 Tax=Ziziphus jujuba var. spinosa TaxID=714518 RepID=A0A978UYG8_ZIZJJ|nr:hypothetical protein FEM48_Zijuj08G0100800 [Ziziphus jujuba var. spinosa]